MGEHTDIDSGLYAESLQHICQTCRVQDCIGGCTHWNFANEIQKQASKKTLAQQNSVSGFDVEYTSGHNRTVGDAVDADFEWSKGAVRHCRPISAALEPSRLCCIENGTPGTHLPA